MLIEEIYQEVRTNSEGEEERYGLGESGLYEPFTDNVKRLFAALQREYGRCVSRVYIDQNKGAIPIGWVFRKRKPYDDSPRETYLAETWVTLHDKQPTVKRTPHYHQLGGNQS